MFKVQRKLWKTSKMKLQICNGVSKTSVMNITVSLTSLKGQALTKQMISQEIECFFLGTMIFKRSDMKMYAANSAMMG